MLSYFFLLAAAASTTELPSDITKAEIEELQEIAVLLTTEENTLEKEDSTAETVAINEKIEIQAQPIIVINAIEPSMLEYKHWTGKYSPESFTISVNGKEVEAGNKCEIPANSTMVEIGYTYSFMNGIKSGGRKISYQLNENITQANITFNWQNDWRVIVDSGKAIKEIS